MGKIMDMALCFFKPNRLLRELLLLIGFEKNPTMSQHDIARVAGISSSMANNYIKNFTAEGFITVHGKTNRTMRYLVSDTGKEHIQSLLSRYTEEVVHLYAFAKQEIEKKLNDLYLSGLQTAVLFGAAETGELVFNAARHTPVEVIGIVDNDINKQHQKFGGLEVMPPQVLEVLRPDAVIITAFGRPEEIYIQIKHLEGEGIAIVRL